ncbi:MAG TPA: protein kinase [Bryobacteraceae bacterium]
MPANVIAGRYEVKELLGEGGMGVVYRAIDTRTGSLVAIKTLRDASDPYTLEMFKKEWAVLARLCHPNIVDVRDVDEIEENGVRKPCFIMPLLPGVTLASLIRTSSPRLTVERIVGIIHQVCLGLQAAHEQDLIHRDLKPSNIFVMDDGTAKIIDFGLVHATDAKSTTGFKGTWQYMAPEQVEGRPPSRRSDIYSLGVVAYEALTGQQPFKKKKLEDTAEAIRRLIPPVISESNPKVSPLVGKVIHIAMAKQPIHRYASAREFDETLQKAFYNQPIERFDAARIKPRIERARAAFSKGDHAFASEILTEIQAEGNVDPEITLLHSQIQESIREKRIQQLFESAQTRLEQDEIPMALEKLREILELDPQNSEAQAMRNRIEEQRSQQQISRWLSLAREHFERHDFSEARQALKEVFHLRYDEPEGLQLLSEINVQEKEAAKARAEKEQLYGSALRLFQSGEISTALSKLEKIIEVSRRTPGATIPERDAVYQAFYNQVRSERDSLDNAYAEGRRHLDEKNFAKALEVCDRILSQHSKNAQFQALRLKVEQAQRQELSAYIAEVGRAVDSERNLDRRVGILEEACKRHPNEAQFQQSLRLVTEHRDLVASILARAKQYEEQGQFGEAIGQWKILANIHQQYPGIDFEISQLERRREQQVAEEKKARFVEQIDRALENSAFAKAEQLVKGALAEFREDPELTILERMVRQGLERVHEADHLFEEAKSSRSQGDSVTATSLLEQALQLDPRSFTIRNMLVGLLVERAHSVLTEDWRQSEPLAQTAAKLDPEHPSVKRIQSLIAERKRKDDVLSCIAEARGIQTIDPGKALSILERALADYPAEPRLLQYRTTLRNLVRETQEPQKSTAHVERASAAAAGAGRTQAASDTTRAFTADSVTGSIFRRELDATVAVPTTERKPVPPPPAKRISVSNVHDWFKKSRDQFEEFFATVAPLTKPVVRSAIAQGKKLKTLDIQSRRVQAALAGLLLLIAGLVVLKHSAGNKTQSSTPESKIQVGPADVSVNVSTVPADANVDVAGVQQHARTLNLRPYKTYDVSVSRLGFKTATYNGMRPTKDGWRFVLKPEPLYINVFTSERAGAVFLDGQKVANLGQGGLTEFEVVPDEGHHILSASNRAGELFRFAFQEKSGARPVVEPLTTKDLIVTSTLGKHASIWSGTLPKTLEIAGNNPQDIRREGLDLDLGADQDRLTVSDAKRRQVVAIAQGNAPSLAVSLEGSPNLGSIAITTTTKNAVLFLDGKEKSTRKAGSWYLKAAPGSHTVKLFAEGMQDVELSIPVSKGENIVKEIEMHPSAASLAVEGGTAGAQVFVDGQEIGALDESGNLLRSGLSSGSHSIEFRKQGFENVTVRQPFATGQRVTLRGGYLKLKEQSARVTISILPRKAKVQFRRSGEGEWHVAPAFTSLPVKPGAYEFEAQADGYKTLSKAITLSSGKPYEISLLLERAEPSPAPTPTATGLFVQPVKQVGSWLTGNTKDFITVRSRMPKFNLIFLRPDHTPPGTRKPKRLEWVVTLGPENRISYSLEGQELVRKKRLGGEESKTVEKADASDGAAAYSVIVTLEEHRVQTKRKDGVLLDEFSDEKRDWSQAKVAIKGDALFVVRPIP